MKREASQFIEGRKSQEKDTAYILGRKVVRRWFRTDRSKENVEMLLWEELRGIQYDYDVKEEDQIIEYLIDELMKDVEVRDELGYPVKDRETRERFKAGVVDELKKVGIDLRDVVRGYLGDAN